MVANVASTLAELVDDAALVAMMCPGSNVMMEQGDDEVKHCFLLCRRTRVRVAPCVSQRDHAWLTFLIQPPIPHCSSAASHTQVSPRYEARSVTVRRNRNNRAELHAGPSGPGGIYRSSP